MILYYRLCVESILLYGSQIFYLSISYRWNLEFFSIDCLLWVTALHSYSQQLAALKKPISFYLVLNDMVFLIKAINNKNDLNLSTHNCFGQRYKDVRYPKHQQFLLQKMSQTPNERVLFSKSLCGYSNFLATIEIDVFDSVEYYKIWTNDLLTQSSLNIQFGSNLLLVYEMPL